MIEERAEGEVLVDRELRRERQLVRRKGRADEFRRIAERDFACREAGALRIREAVIRRAVRAADDAVVVLVREAPDRYGPVTAGRVAGLMALIVIGAEANRRYALAQAEQLVRRRAAVEVDRSCDVARIEELCVHRVLEAGVLDASEILETSQRLTFGWRNPPRDDRVVRLLAVVRDLGADAIVPDTGVETDLVFLRQLGLELQIADAANCEARNVRRL